MDENKRRNDVINMKYIKENWKFLLFVVIIGLIGGVFTGYYTLEFIDEKTLEEAINALGTKDTLIIVTLLQTMIYTIICGVFGIILSNKVGLWKKIKIEIKPDAIPLT